MEIAKKDRRIDTLSWLEYPDVIGRVPGFPIQSGAGEHQKKSRFNAGFFYFMAWMYIIYSSSLDRYYVGSTRGSIEERLRKHKSKHKGFTGQADELFAINI